MLLCFAVYKCAVSPTGDRLYIINRYQHKLLTLARDGTLLATYTDYALRWPRGQVLVCGLWSNTVLQMGREGESKLATLATREDGHHIIHHCWTSGIVVIKKHQAILLLQSLLSQDKDAEDVVDKDDLNTQKVTKTF
ncbi:hypothetical protein DPMN_003258 [Dreissena polymorpha]|uniref:Uncharacterized protein n=1 Tax=Dreissena polymorpha TaxID=45954 RepID=A0A9D4MPL3_DREPO|nr:hypothetical protein DPMN_003258 [Dreissena polymorpha]